jgi:hypothetical protein
MRKSIITILGVMLMTLFIGTAFADPWVTNGNTATARYNIAIPDAYTFTAHDATFGGAISVGAGTISGGVYDGDWRLAANHWLYSTAGTGGLNFANDTGFFNTSTGTNYINGNMIQATLKNYTMQGASTFTSGTGAFDVNGPLTSRNITLDANHNVVTSGTGTITSAATITGEDIRSTDDAYVADDAVIDGGARIDETATVNALSSNTTVAATSADGLTVNSVIVPVYETITIPIGASSVDEYVFVADDAWWLVKAEEIHVAAGNNTVPTAANLTIRVCDDNEAVGNGVNATTAVIPLGDAVNNINTASLSGTNGMLADGDMIAFDYAGTLTGLRGSVTLTLRRM